MKLLDTARTGLQSLWAALMPSAAPQPGERGDRLASGINVPINTTLLAIEKGSAVYLEEGDSLRLTASAASSLEAVCSYEEIA